MISCCRIIITPEAMRFAKSNRKDRESYSKNRPLYCIHYRGSENGSICVDLETLAQVAIMCKFPSRKLKDSFLNNFLGTMSFPEEMNVLYDWLYKPSERHYYDWKHIDD